MKYIRAWFNLMAILILILFCIFIAPKIIILFMPFIIGWIISLTANPAVCFLEKKLRIKRKTGSVLVITGVILTLSYGIYFFMRKAVAEVGGFIQNVPQMWQDMELRFSSLGNKWESVIDRFPDELVVKVRQIGGDLGREMGSILGELSVPTADAVGSLAQGIPNGMIFLIMCLLSSYFFVAEKHKIDNIITKILPKSWTVKCIILKQTTIDVLAGYVKAQFKIEIWIYLLIVMGLLLLKVRSAYLIAIPISLLDILPLFGTGTILVPWALFNLLSGKYTFALGLLAIWGVSQLVRQLIQPKMIGKAVGMQPLPTLILLYIGYKIAGFMGMIFAVPFGMLAVAMNGAGFFDNTKLSIKVLWNGFDKLRNFTEEEKEEIEIKCSGTLKDK